MRSVLTTKFHLMWKKNLNGTLPGKLFLRVIVDRKKVEIFLGHSISQNNWDDLKQRTKNDLNLNEELTFIENRIFEIRRTLEFNKTANNKRLPIFNFDSNLLQ